MSWILDPIHAFRLGPLQVIEGRLVSGDPLVTRPKKVSFFADEKNRKEIAILGTSTASPLTEGCVDYRYEGPEISQAEIGSHSIITDSDYQEALEEARRDAGSSLRTGTFG